MAAPKRIIIFGTGGNCLDILDTLNDINARAETTLYQCAGFLDDNPERIGSQYLGVPVLGPLDSACEYKDCFFVNGIGSVTNFWHKREIIDRAGIPIDQFENVIHPTASVSRTAKLGKGVVVFQNVTITTQVTIGHHVIILPNSVISHDDVIGDYTCITGGVTISGLVTAGSSCYFGTNSAVNGRVTIGDFCLVGMGSVVLHDVPDRSVMVGNPARWLRNTFD